MNPERDPWMKLVDASREVLPEAAPPPNPDETAPLGFSTRVIAQWKSKKEHAPPSLLDLFERCAIPSACAAVLGLALLFAIHWGTVSHETSSAGLFDIPDIASPTELN